ncbi:hypothetical protein J6590_011485 [Homalodisca vitripennis]|nr:hypothetical protein J6590_011485 [Homalodisca vitripennis]
MGDRPAAERACKDPNPIIDGRKANVNLAILGAKPRGNIQPGPTGAYQPTDIFPGTLTSHVNASIVTVLTYSRPGRIRGCTAF